MEEIVEFLLKTFEIEKRDVNEFSPLVLAYIGDVVYELIVRTVLVSKGNRPVNKLNNEATSLVKAGAQASILKLIKPDLSDEELRIFKRGRNSSPHTIAKNAGMSDYKYATGFECLVGYLYLDNNFKRALDLVRIGMERFMADCVEQKTDE